MSHLFDVKHQVRHRLVLILVFNLFLQLVFYGQYHSNKYNVAIHICFVPVILW